MNHFALLVCAEHLHDTLDDSTAEQFVSHDNICDGNFRPIAQTHEALFVNATAVSVVIHVPHVDRDRGGRCAGGGRRAADRSSTTTTTPSSHELWSYSGRGGSAGWSWRREVAEDLVGVITYGLKKCPTIMLNPGVLEVVTLLQFMGPSERRQVVTAPLGPVLVAGYGFSDLSCEVLEKVVNAAESRDGDGCGGGDRSLAN